MRKNQITSYTCSILGFALMSVVSLQAQAAVSPYTWDASGTNPTAPTDGSGTWSTSTSYKNWSNGTTDVAWPNTTSTNAFIGSGNNTVSGVQDITLNVPITLGNITFGTVSGGSYDILGTSSNYLGMTGSTPTVTVNANVTAEIDAPIAVTGSQPDLTVAGAGTLDFNPTIEGSNFHGVILGGTANVVLLSAAAVPLVIPNNNTAANFDGGTLTFAATPTTDISGRITTTGSSAVNIGVTNGALVTFGNTLGGSGGLNVTGSGSGSTLELTESSGSEVGYNGSGGVSINGATLYLTGNNNNELGSNNVTVGINGTLSSNSTKLVTTGSTTINGTVTGGSGALSTNSIGIMKLSATTLDSGGTYVAKIITGTVSSDTPGTTSDELTMTGLTTAATSSSPFDINLESQGTTTLASGTQIILAVTNSGSFNTSDLHLETTGVSAPSGYTIGLGTIDGGDDLIAQDVATPEPTGLILVGIVITPLLLGRHRGQCTNS